jgi:hypothetical protein
MQRRPGPRALLRWFGRVLIAVGLALPTSTVALGQAVSADENFLDELIADLGFQPRELIERVRYLAKVPYEAPTQHRLSYCVDAYADRISKDPKWHEQVVAKAEQAACTRFQLCPRPDRQLVDQSAAYAALLRVLAREMRGEMSADSSQAFTEHEAFVKFGRRLASLRGVEDGFKQAASINGELSAPHILASCPPAWPLWPIVIGGLLAACAAAGGLIFLYNRRPAKPAPM